MFFKLYICYFFLIIISNNIFENLIKFENYIKNKILL